MKKILSLSSFTAGDSCSGKDLVITYAVMHFLAIQDQTVQAVFSLGLSRV